MCPKCLATCPINKAFCWNTSSVENAVEKSDKILICRNAHRVDVSSLSGLYSENTLNTVNFMPPGTNTVKVNDLLGGVVLVCGYDDAGKKIVRAGSGFILDKKRGLILTAAHTLLDLKNGIPYRQKIVIGIIPDRKTELNRPHPAVFRYTAQIIGQDPLFQEKKVCTIDACILKIVSKFETDVHCGQDLYKLPEVPLYKRGIKEENLSQLKLQENCEIEERVRIIGFNQGGENIRKEGSWLFRNIGCTPGIINELPNYDFELIQSERSPRSEIVVTCDTISGESGGPCVNDNGEVVGILSRGHGNRSYLVPISECMKLVKEEETKIYI